MEAGPGAVPAGNSASGIGQNQLAAGTGAGESSAIATGVFTASSVGSTASQDRGVCAQNLCNAGFPGSADVSLAVGGNRRGAHTTAEQSGKCEGKAPHMSEAKGEYNVEVLPFGRVFNLNLYDGPQANENVERYFQLCRDHSELQVTTSCFAVWMQNKRVNGFGKVIPAIPASRAASYGNVRIFFFDDNIEWGGRETSPGICNLRDVATGEFVVYTEGTNGFQNTRHLKHTAIHSSVDYRNVLVKASILDAMENQDYFLNIINMYSVEGDNIIVYMDVNSTIMCNDTVQGKSLEESLRSVMFELIQLAPHAPFDLEWEGLAPLRVEKPKTLKQMVKDLHHEQLPALREFWKEEACQRVLEKVSAKGNLAWMHTGLPVGVDQFQEDFQGYLKHMATVTKRDGLVDSWFRAFEALKGRHKVVLNSFGVDSHKVVLATVPDESNVLAVAINFEKWSDRDVQIFKKSFES